MLSPDIDPRLWMLISPALPVGGYSYSQGLEQAVWAGWVTDLPSARDWITNLGEYVLSSVDLPYLARLYQSFDASDIELAAHWNADLLACRETAELRAEDQAMGEALGRLLSDLVDMQPGRTLPATPTFAAGFALACHEFDLSLDACCAAYAWVWYENQIAAAIKLVPLGQTDGQRLLLGLASSLAALVDVALAREDWQLGMTAPGLAIASAAHETQYTRLFRS